jgi:membrane protease subunit HflC
MNKLLSIFALLIFPVILLSVQSFYRVDETEQVIITQFGKPVGKIISDSGLKLKIPFIQKVNRIEKRILLWDGAANDMPTKDK